MVLMTTGLDMVCIPSSEKVYGQNRYGLGFCIIPMVDIIGAGMWECFLEPYHQPFFLLDHSIYLFSIESV
jgi:hypothetical protein